MLFVRSVARAGAGLTLALGLLAASSGAAPPAAPATDGADVLAAAPATSPSGEFRSLFQAWKSFDGPDHVHVALPSRRPVDGFRYMSSFRVRSDPFRGNAADPREHRHGRSGP